MPRPRQIADPVAVNVRLERADTDALTARDGSVSAGVRNAVSAYLGTASRPEPVRSERARGGSTPLVAIVDEVSDPAVSAALDKAVKPHRHRRGAPLETRFEQGTKVQTFSCSVQGCPAVLS